MKKDKRSKSKPSTVNLVDVAVVGLQIVCKQHIQQQNPRKICIVETVQAPKSIPQNIACFPLDSMIFLHFLTPAMGRWFLKYIRYILRKISTQI